MVNNPKFDEARRKLDAALGELGGATGTPAANPDAPGDMPARPGRRVAPSRRRASVPRRVAQGPAGLARQGKDSTTEPEQAGAGPTIVRLAPPAPLAPAAPLRTPPPITADPSTSEVGAAPPTSEALARLVVGSALLGLDGLAARSARWEAQAGIRRPHGVPAAAEGTMGSARFRHALIGWVFEAEEQLRPRGNPIAWLRAVVAYAFGTVFSVVLEVLPLPRPRRGKGARAELSDEETLRWARRGQAEEERSRRFAQVAIAALTDEAILAVTRRPAMGQALAEITRSAAMDEVVRQIVAGPVIEEAIARVVESPALDTIVTRVAQSPAIDQAVAQIARSPAMEDAVRHIVGTQAMSEAIDTLAKSPALVDLVTTQSTSVAFEVLGEVRERAVSADKLAEGLMRRLFRRTPRAKLPLEARGLPLPADPPPEPPDEDSQTREEG